MDTYEKKYNEAMLRADEAVQKGCLDKDMFDNIFPPEEDEDERIRKWLVDYFGSIKATVWIHRDITCEQILSWLEKHKEQKPHLELKAGKWYICHRAFCARADHLTVKEGERFQCEKDGIVKGFVIKEPEKYFKECGAPAPMEDEQKEQKPAWSEEDEKMLDDICSHLYAIPEERDKMQKWLKSLRPSWKPSEEQMNALNFAITYFMHETNYKNPTELRELYDELLKLK